MYVEKQRALMSVNMSVCFSVYSHLSQVAKRKPRSLILFDHRSLSNNMEEQPRGRRSTSVRQLELLVEFLENHRDLALGRVRTKEARLGAERLWHECAELLNVAGPPRSAKEWPKVWNDLKCRIRGKLVTINANYQATGGGPSSAATLTDLENRVANILGRDVGPLPNVRQNQLAISYDDNSMVEEVDNTVETHNVSQEIVLSLTEVDQEREQEARPAVVSPEPSLTGQFPPTPSRSQRPRRVREQRRTERTTYQTSAQAMRQSNRTALEESRAMILNIETLRAEAAHQNAQALRCFAEGFKLIAESIDRFSQMYSQQRGEDRS